MAILSGETELALGTIRVKQVALWTAGVINALCRVVKESNGDIYSHLTSISTVRGSLAPTRFLASQV